MLLGGRSVLRTTVCHALEDEEQSWGMSQTKKVSGKSHAEKLAMGVPFSRLLQCEAV